VSEVSGLLTAAGLVVAVGDLALLAGCWKQRSVLGGLPAVAGLALVALATLAESGGQTSADELAIAAVALVLGTVLFAIAQALERLLDRSPEGPA
jgi:hypothetical protein